VYSVTFWKLIIGREVSGRSGNIPKAADSIIYAVLPMLCETDMKYDQEFLYQDQEVPSLCLALQMATCCENRHHF
jgi:hypothetical protein